MTIMMKKATNRNWYVSYPLSVLTIIIVSLLSLTNHICVLCEQYTFDYGPKGYQNKYPFTTIKTSLSSRSLQTAEAKCDPVGARYKCTISTQLNENNDNDATNKTGAYTALTIYTECDLDDDIGFDFRRSNNCDCEAHVHRVLANGTSPMDKYCPCIICTKGFGNNPISIDCTPWDHIAAANAALVNASGTSRDTASTTSTNATQYPDSIIMNTCSSLDCGMACNGTCRIDCDNSDQSCPFCSNNPNNTEPPQQAATTADAAGSAGAVTASSDGGSGEMQNYDGKPIHSHSYMITTTTSYTISTILLSMLFLLMKY